MFASESQGQIILQGSRDLRYRDKHVGNFIPCAKIHASGLREMENLLENLVITTPDDVIRRENLPQKLREAGCSSEPAAGGAAPRERGVEPLRSVVERAEREAIQSALSLCGSVRKAAAALEVDPSTLVRKMQRRAKNAP